jgi:EamA domain-containing membrane protein RarD
LVRLLYTNVVGVAPTDAQTADFVTLLNSGVFTQVSLTTFAADHALNMANVGLTGLAQDGLEFLPFPG